METLCKTCAHTRKIADKLFEEGNRGCCILAKRGQHSIDKGEDGEDPQNPDVSFIGDAEELSIGWVDLRARQEGSSSGIKTNFMLITKGVTKCLHYQEEKRS